MELNLFQALQFMFTKLLGLKLYSANSSTLASVLPYSVSEHSSPKSHFGQQLYFLGIISVALTWNNFVKCVISLHHTKGKLKHSLLTKYRNQV